MDEQKRKAMSDGEITPADELDLDEFKSLAGMDTRADSVPETLNDYDDTTDLLGDFKEFSGYFDPVREDEIPAANAGDFDPNELNEKLRQLDLGELAEPDVTPSQKKQEIKEPTKQQEPAPAETKKQAEKGIKVQRRQKTGCFGALLFFAFVVGVSTLVAVFGWMAARDVLALGKDDVTAVVEIERTDTVAEVAEKLHDSGLVEYPFLFKLYGAFAKIDEEQKISAGSFELNSTMDYRALVTAMNSYSDNRVTVSLVFPEGYELRQIVALLAENGVATEEDLWETLANYDFEYSFLEGKPLGDKMRLEGYLFPDKYDFYLNENTVTVVNKMLSNFNSKFTEEMRVKAGDMGYSVEEILTIASMIEREAAGDDERTTIASVIYNRLNSDGFPCLQIDATVQYALGTHKTSLTSEDMEVDSPYNTYKYPGLPAGPIASPGLKSIQAALNPESTGYYYYALNKDGAHNFFTNYDDHVNFVNSEEYGG